MAISHSCELPNGERVYEVRAFLAHGKITATAGGISISHITFDGKAEHRAPAKQLTRFDMLAELAAIEAAQKSLHQQLGQIKARARQMAASAALWPLFPRREGPRP